MKVLSVILKIIETGVVCVWGVFFGIFFPAVILAMGPDAGIIPEDIAARTDIMVLWLITSAVGYLIPAALIFMKHYRIAAGLSLLGLAGVLTVKAMFGQLYIYTEGSSGPDELYLPLIFATLLDIFILGIEERKNIAKLFESSSSGADEKAPSILGDDNNDE